MNVSASLWRRFKQGKLDYRLSVLQLAVFTSTIGVIMCVILLYRHFTDDALIEIWDYLSSVNVTIPPLAVLVATYLFAIVTGAHVAEAPKAMLIWIRNDALQNPALMLGFLITSFIFCVVSVTYLTRNPSPAYERLIAQLLGGENDDQHVIEVTIKNLKDKNPIFATRVNIANEIFAERRRWNHENKQPSEALPRAWIRALDVNLDDNWKEHPLRWHALAEAHSMMMQAIMNKGGSTSAATIMTKVKNKALQLYQQLLSSKDPRITELQRKSAAQNLGNVYLYAGDFQKALDQYDLTINDNRSLATEANRVVALVQLGRFADAISRGEDAQIWALDNGRVLTELRDYISLVSNKGFVHLITGTNINGLVDMTEVFELLPDTMARQNLGLAYVVNEKPDEAIEVLAEDIEAPIVTPTSESDIVVKYGGGSCTYFIRGLAYMIKAQQNSEASANFAAYLRRADSEDHLADIQQWSKPAWLGLQKDKRPCNSLRLIPKAKDILTKPLKAAQD